MECLLIYMAVPVDVAVSDVALRGVPVDSLVLSVLSVLSVLAVLSVLVVLVVLCVLAVLAVLADLAVLAVLVVLHAVFLSLSQHFRELRELSLRVLSTFY